MTATGIDPKSGILITERNWACCPCIVAIKKSKQGLTSCVNSVTVEQTIDRKMMRCQKSILAGMHCARAARVFETGLCWLCCTILAPNASWFVRLRELRVAR